MVTKTFADGLPGATCRLCSSTISTMQTSSLKTKTGSSGAVTPNKPSVDPNTSTSAAPNARAMAVRWLGSRVSLVEVIPAGAMRSLRPTVRSKAVRACSRSRRPQPAGRR
jgi:hypothetical protein